LSRLAAAGKSSLPIIDTIIVLQCFFLKNDSLQIFGFQSTPKVRRAPFGSIIKPVFLY
jgi:hypothetical protein